MFKGKMASILAVAAISASSFSANALVMATSAPVEVVGLTATMHGMGQSIQDGCGNIGINGAKHALGQIFSIKKNLNLGMTRVWNKNSSQGYKTINLDHSTLDAAKCDHLINVLNTEWSSVKVELIRNGWVR